MKFSVKSILIFILFISKLSFTHSAEFNGKFIQGSYIKRKTEPGSIVLIDDCLSQAVDIRLI